MSSIIYGHWQYQYKITKRHLVILVSVQLLLYREYQKVNYGYLDAALILPKIQGVKIDILEFFKPKNSYILMYYCCMLCGAIPKTQLFVPSFIDFFGRYIFFNTKCMRCRSRQYEPFPKYQHFSNVMHVSYLKNVNSHQNLF